MTTTTFDSNTIDAKGRAEIDAMLKESAAAAIDRALRDKQAEQEKQERFERDLAAAEARRYTGTKKRGAPKGRR